MSKRRRRNSRRRKCSFSTKQTISSNSVKKNIKTTLDYMRKEDHSTKKGETDSFYIKISSSDEEEKENENPSKEKASEQQSDRYKNEKSNITVQVDEDKKLRITHSVTLCNFGEKTSIVIEITAFKVEYKNSDVRIEITEMVQSEKSNIKTSFNLQNKKEMEKQNLTHQTSKREGFIHHLWIQHANKYEQNGFEVMTKLRMNKDLSRKQSSLSGPDTDFTILDGTSTCSSPHSFCLRRRRSSQAESHCNETLSNVSSSSRSDIRKNDMPQDLTESIVTYYINDSNVLKKEKAPQNDPDDVLSTCQFLVPKVDIQTNLLHDKLNGGTPWTTTKNDNHKDDIQMHTDSHSIIDEDILKKRRKTYPGVVYHSGHNVESKSSCKSSFSSGTISLFFMQSVLCQSEKAARYYLAGEKEGIIKTNNHNFFSSTSSQPSLSFKHRAHTNVSNNGSLIPTKNPFYSMSYKFLKDVLLKCKHEQIDAAVTADQICVNKAEQESILADPMEQSEVAESGFDEEMEGENPIALTDDDPKNLLIHITTPSVCTSKEHTTNQLHKIVQAHEKQIQHSVVAVTGGFEQRRTEQKHQSEKELNFAYSKEPLKVYKQNADAGKHKQLTHTTARHTSFQSARTCNQTEKRPKKTALAKVKEHLKPGDSILEETSEHWAKKRKLFRESRHWGSAEESSTSNITDESDTLNSEDTRSIEISLQDIEERGFYTETFHSASWIYRGDDANPNTMQCLSNRARHVAVRERTVKISKGMGEYPWGFRIQYSKPIIVTEVDTNGAAEEAGLKVGDYVLAVNGTDVTGVPHSEAVDLARQGPDLLILTIGSDIGRTPNTPKPVCRGYLHKRTQSSFLKGWRKRWFVLRHDSCLYYYRNKRDEGNSHALSGMRLEGAVVEADTSLGKQFVFKCSPVSGNRVYYFCAMSNQEMRRWLEVLERAVHPIMPNHVWVDVTCHNSNLPPLAVKNPECLGLLNLLDKNKDTCIQYYCILKDGCLYFYSGIRSTYAVGGIYLHGYTVKEQPLGFRRPIIELKPPSEEFKVFYLCAENVNENKRWIGVLKTSIGKWLPWHQALQDYMSRPLEETKM